VNLGAELSALFTAADLAPDEIIKRLRRSGYSVGRSSLYDWLKGLHLPDDADVLLAVVRICRAEARQRGASVTAELSDDAHWENLLLRAKQARDSRAERYGQRAAAHALPARGTVHTLPADVASFTGRRAELERIRQELPGRSASGGVVRIDAIDGMAGIGKTALAVHAAHQLAGQFPDGQIFLRLHGHTPGQQPLEPSDALATLLLATGMSADQVPRGLEARQQLWRDRLAGKKVLLVLDDATGSDQVRPLLPGSASTLVLVTSRRRLSALADAVPLTLEPLEAEDATVLFVRLSLRPGLQAADQGIARIVALCDYLPLAIRLMAGKLKYRATWSTSDLAADLASASSRLDYIQAENESVTAAFNLSFRDLNAKRQRFFRRLGLCPGSDIDAYAAAALDGTNLNTAHASLDDLYSHHLIDEPTRGRYRFHDLIREHAAALSKESSRAEREQAMARLFDYYLCGAITAAREIDLRFTQRAPELQEPVLLPDLSTRELATEWIRAERLNLQAAAAYAAQHAQPGYAADIAAAMHWFLFFVGPWDQALDLYNIALTAARRAGEKRREAMTLTSAGLMQFLAGDRLAAEKKYKRGVQIYHDIGDLAGEAEALHGQLATSFLARNLTEVAADLTYLLGLYEELGNSIGQADVVMDRGLNYGYMGNCLAAAADIERALSLYQERGDRRGEAMAHNNKAIILTLTGSYADAIAEADNALSRFRSLDIKQGEANTLIALGRLQCLTGSYPAAVVSQEKSLQLYRELGDRGGEADALSSLGTALHARGDHQAARQSLEQALELQRSVGNKIGQAEALNNLGALTQTLEAYDEAQVYHRQALTIARDLALPLEEARALEGIGLCYLRTGHENDAFSLIRQAAALYHIIDSPGARHVDELLRSQGL
jgi:tetratricopeptide (TPR) repeat protein